MAEPRTNELMEKIVSLCKRRGFIFQSSEIYGGINGFWDYGPLGAELKRNVKDCWWRGMTQERDDIAGLDATIIMHPRIWEASGHVTTFSDPMVDCLLSNKRFRADQIEPQDGTAYTYAGAVDEALAFTIVEAWIKSPGARPVPELLESPDLTPVIVELVWQRFSRELMTAASHADAAGRISAQAFSVLLPKGKHPEHARKVARQFYQKRGIARPVVFGEASEDVVGTTRYNPENGSLLTEARAFNLMFKTIVGPIESDENIAYLRPETAQAIFVQFKNVLECSRRRVPFGVAQIGKAFRNEITPRNYTFRSREFEQMELEFFIKPDEAVEAISGPVGQVADGAWQNDPQANWGWEVWHKHWVEQRIRFYEGIGLPRTSLEEYWQKPEELAHYARATVDILYKFPFGTQELEGIAARSDFDLSQHQRCSGKSMTVFDEELKAAWPKLDAAKQQDLRNRYCAGRLKYLTKTGETEENAAAQANADADALTKGYYVPHVIEPSAGVDRLVLALLCNAYSEDQAPDEKGKLESRVVMRFHPRIAPIKVAVFPLLKNRPELVAKARAVRDLLRPFMTVFYDDAGAIGRRYRRQDEAGTPFGVTIDFDTLGEKPELKDTVTLRDRDTMKQDRVRIEELLPILLPKIR